MAAPTAVDFSRYQNDPAFRARVRTAANVLRVRFNGALTEHSTLLTAISIVAALDAYDESV